MQQYDHPDRLLVAVDCIVFGFAAGRLQLLLIRRDFEPYRGAWSLMGGFLHRNESLDAAAYRILRELTGLESVYLEQFRAFGQVDRDSVERTISVGYYALVNWAEVTPSLSDRYSAHWVPLDELPPLIFDHAAMVDLALERLRYRAMHEPVGFDLLPERFTLSQLRQLYAAIFGQEVDAGNFRRRLRNMDFLVRTDEKDFSDSRRGAWLYRFRSDRYAEAKEEGFSFLLKP